VEQPDEIPTLHIFEDLAIDDRMVEDAEVAEAMDYAEVVADYRAEDDNADNVPLPSTAYTIVIPDVSGGEDAQGGETMPCGVRSCDAFALLRNLSLFYGGTSQLHRGTVTSAIEWRRLFARMILREQ